VLEKAFTRRARESRLPWDTCEEMWRSGPTTARLQHALQHELATSFYHAVCQRQVALGCLPACCSPVGRPTFSFCFL